MLRKTSLALLVVLGACGDDGGGTPDARRFDAPIPPIDSEPIDAAPANYVGQLTILEAEVVIPAAAPPNFASFGQGPSFRMAFIDPQMTGAPVMEEMPGSPFGCKAFEYTPAQFGATLGVDLGTIAISFVGGVNVPTCIYQAGAGYVCPALMTASAGDNALIGATPDPRLFTYTEPDVMYNASAVGRYLNITGATAATNNGAFPIVQLAAPTTIVFANPAAVAGATPVGGSSVTIAGVGPTPGAPDPGFIANDASMQVDFTTTDQPAFPNFTGTLTDLGDDFILDDASKRSLFSIPTDGTELTLDCATPADCGSAASSVLNLQTTDGALAGLSPFAMPPPVTKAVLVRCTSMIGGGAGVTIPAAYSAFIQNSGATRIQATFVRGSTASTPGLSLGKLVVVGGHSSVGFTTVP